MSKHDKNYDYYKVPSQNKQGYKTVRVPKGTPFCHLHGCKASACANRHPIKGESQSPGRTKCFQCIYWILIEPPSWTQWGAGISGFKARQGVCSNVTRSYETSAHQYCGGAIARKDEIGVKVFDYPDDSAVAKDKNFIDTATSLTFAEFKKQSFTEIQKGTGFTKVIWRGTQMTSEQKGSKAKKDVYDELVRRAMKRSE